MKYAFLSAALRQQRRGKWFASFIGAVAKSLFKRGKAEGKTVCTCKGKGGLPPES